MTIHLRLLHSLLAYSFSHLNVYWFLLIICFHMFFSVFFSLFNCLPYLVNKDEYNTLLCLVLKLLQGSCMKVCK